MQACRDIYDYFIKDWNLSGWKVRMVARSHMLNAMICELVYTYWVFSIPKNWHPDLKGQGPFEPRHFRIFCFFVYNVSLFVNCGQFFNGLLLYSCVDRGIRERDGAAETCRFYTLFSAVFCVICGLKFCLLFFYLKYGLLFCLIMTVPELIGLVIGMDVIMAFNRELEKMNRIVDLTPYSIAKNGKIIFDPSY